MDIINRFRSAVAVEKLIGQLGALQGPTLTIVTSGALVLSEWLTNNTGLFGDAATPWVIAAIAVLQGAYSLLALLTHADGGKTNLVKAVITQSLLVGVSVGNAFLPLLDEQSRAFVQDFIPVMQTALASRWLRETAT